jgi:hypothetical protein
MSAERALWLAGRLAGARVAGAVRRQESVNTETRGNARQRR